MAQVADAAQISRATAYRYFPSQEMLLAEAMLQPDVDPTIERALAEAEAAGGDAASHLDALVQALLAATVAHEEAFRTLLRLSLTPPAEGRRMDLPAPPRGGRRVRWIEQILASIGTLDAVQTRRMVAALALCMGIEAFIVLRDVCGLTLAEAEEVSRWAAQALLEAGMSAARASSRSRPQHQGSGEHE